MILGIEETTDHRSPETKLVKFASEPAARRWAALGGGFAWPGAADSSLPVHVQNWHRRLREVWTTSGGFRLPSVHQWERLPHGDRRSLVELRASAVRRVGTRLETSEAR